jgi:hypothetical protein
MSSGDYPASDLWGNSRPWGHVWMRQCVSPLAIWLMVAVATAAGIASGVP